MPTLESTINKVMKELKLDNLSPRQQKKFARSNGTLRRSRQLLDNSESQPWFSH
jgi:hypothetical protein